MTDNDIHFETKMCAQSSASFRICRIKRLRLSDSTQRLYSTAINSNSILKSNKAIQWNEINHRRFMDRVAKQLDITHPDDWYRVNTKDIIKHGGVGLLNHYNHSLVTLLSQVYPETNWIPWKFDKCPQNYWNDINNQRKFMEWAATQLNINQIHDWYKISVRDYRSIGGTGLLTHYKNSPLLLLSAIFPEHEWQPWKFSSVPKSFSKSEQTMQEFMRWAEKQLSIKEISDWQKVAKSDFIALGGSSLLSQHNGSMQKLLSHYFPDMEWKESKGLHYKKSQAMLKTMLKKIFPHHDFLYEYKHPEILSPSGYPLEFDYFYPQLNLAIEYQGQQHYSNSSMFQGDNLETSKKRDLTKQKLCREKGITLIEVPYWWDRKSQSLEATIYKSRPDLFSEAPDGSPIPTEFVSEAKAKKARQRMITATLWNVTDNPKGWWLSEKFDGIRMYWTGSDFISRQGNKIHVPPSLKNQFPKIALDCELWTQYGLYQDAVSLVNTLNEEKWKKAIFWVFDCPDIGDKPYEDRVQYLKNLKLPDFVRIIEPVKCDGEKHLQEFFENVVKKGGEGVMLREAGSLYKAGRSTSLRKYKAYFDTEVKVIENNYPHGFNCQQINGLTVFVVINENIEEAKKIKEGNIITVKHSGTNIHGKLQYPKFFRERHDVNWNDLIK